MTDDPTTAAISCPKCGYEGSIEVQSHGGNRRDEDPPHWTGTCPNPRCREDLDSRDLDECRVCGTFGQKLYDGRCGDCRHAQITDGVAPATLEVK